MEHRDHENVVELNSRGLATKKKKRRSRKRGKLASKHEPIYGLGTSSVRVPSSDLWTGRSSSRPASIHSCSSSMNSSLRGDRAFDPEEQEPSFPADDQNASSPDINRTSPTLPPPPAKLGEEKYVEC